MSNTPSSDRDFEIEIRGNTTNEEDFSQKHILLGGMWVIGDAELKQIARRLEQYADSVSFEFDCRDNSRHRFGTAEEAEQFENLSNQRIVELRIHAWSSNGRNRDARVCLGPRNARIHLRGPSNFIDEADWLRNFVLETRPWYSVISGRIVGLFFSLSVFAFLSFQYVFRIRRRLTLNWDGMDLATWNEMFLDSTAALLIAMVSASTYAIATYLVAWLFPKCNFTIGKGKLRYERGEFIRKSIVIGFFVSLMASFASALVLR